MFQWMIFIMVLPFTLSAAIKQINSIYESEQHFESSDTKILGIFEFMSRLLIPQDPAFQKPNLKKHACIVQGFRE